MFGTDFGALLSWFLSSLLHIVLQWTGVVLFLLSDGVLPQQIVGYERNLESVFIKVPKGFSPFSDAKVIFSKFFNSEILLFFQYFLIFCLQSFVLLTSQLIIPSPSCHVFLHISVPSLFFCTHISHSFIIVCGCTLIYR